MVRIMLLRPGALGDLLLAVPALVALRTSVSDAHITLVGHAGGVKLLQEAGVADEGISQDDVRLLTLFLHHATAPGEDGSKSALSTIGEFDIAVGWLKDAEGIVAASFKRMGIEKTVIAPSAPQEGAQMHVADHLLRTLSPLGISPVTPARFPLRTSASAQVWAEQYLSAFNLGVMPVVAVHPGSGSERKNWSPDKFAGAIDRLHREGVAVVLICGPADESAITGVMSCLDRSVPVACGLVVSRLAALIAKCNAYLGNDSGVTHLAALVGTPTIALFGPTDPAIWGPRGDRVEILRWQDDRGLLTPERVARVVLEEVGKQAVETSSPMCYSGGQQERE